MFPFLASTTNEEHTKKTRLYDFKRKQKASFGNTN